MKSLFSGKICWAKHLLVGLLLMPCYPILAQHIPAKPVTNDLFQPLTLNRDTTVIYLTDFFVNPSKIDSVTLPSALSWKRNKDNTLTVVVKGDLPILSTMLLWSGGYAYNVLLRRSKREYYTFTFDPKGNTYKTVQLAGEMNDWNPKNTPFTLKDGKWQLRILLNPGVYQYQIVTDDKWMLDPANPDSVDNNNGGFNSVFRAGMGNEKQKPFLEGTALCKGCFSFDITGDGKPTVMAFWQNFWIPALGIKDTYTIYLPPQAKAFNRSYIRVYAFNDKGESNSLLVPLEKGAIVTDPNLLTRNDKQADAIYFAFVDRFCDGDSSNDKKVKDPRVKPKANYYGGDLAGIQQQLDKGYFKQLHCNTLWISPIVQNPETAFQEYPAPHDWYSGYHGYWPISLTQIDHRFGNNQVFSQLVTDAHKNGMNVLIDLVANHVHEDYPLIKQHPEWRTQLDLPDGTKNIRLWDTHRLTTWFDTFLPTLDFTQPTVLKLQVDSSAYWITKFGIDGFRHDATKHIPTPFWRALTLKLKNIAVEKGKTIYQLGETYGSKELINSYIGSGLLDGQFDFNLYFDARNTFAKDNVGFQQLAATLQQSLDTYGSHNLMGNISGNHDQPRFTSLAGGALSFTEDARKAGWERDVEVGNDTAYLKFACLHAFNATIPGIPVIYYGDEIGMPGAGDPDDRRMMKFTGLSPQEQQLKNTVSKLMELRRQHMSLLYGDFRMLQADQHIMAYQRQYFGETAIVVFNNDGLPHQVTIHTPDLSYNKLTANFNVQHWDQKSNDTIQFQLPAKSFEIFFSEAKQP